MSQMKADLRLGLIGAFTGAGKYTDLLRNVGRTHWSTRTPWLSFFSLPSELRGPIQGFYNPMQDILLLLASPRCQLFIEIHFFFFSS